MQAFHNNPAIKAKYCGRMAAHIAADELIHGVGWEDGKGCAIGCTFHRYDHTLGPIELGLPAWLIRLEDTIFEKLANKQARDFVSRFLQVIPVGADVEMVKHQLAIRRIDRLSATQRQVLGRNEDEVKTIIQKVLDTLGIMRRCHEAAMSGNSCDWPAVKSAAWSAVRSAESAAQSAAVWAESAAWSAELAAWSAARSAAWSAESAAWSAARSAESAAWSAARSVKSAAGSAARSAESAESAAWSAAKSAARSAWEQEAADLLELLAATTK